MEISEVKQILEALLFVSEKPLSIKELKDVLKEDYSDIDNIENLLLELQNEYEKIDKPYEIKYIADGWTFATKPSFSPWIKKLLKEKTVLKLSPSALETLAMIAYKQPVTRAEIDELRGVESSGVLDTLLERKLIKIVGRKETLGRPLLYGTTQDFLRHFGLAHLSELPLIKDMPKEMQETENAPEPELPFEGQETETDMETAPESDFQEQNQEKPEEDEPLQDNSDNNIVEDETISDETDIVSSGAEENEEENNGSEFENMEQEKDSNINMESEDIIIDEDNKSD